MERVNILHNSSYHAQRPNISKEQTEEFKYPCVWYVKKGDSLILFYSSINTKGHFGVPKLIFSSGRIKSVGSFIDSTGEYGLTEFCYGIIDEPENLPKIKETFDSKKFRELMEYCNVQRNGINIKIIGLLRKDFWKEFIEWKE